MNVLVAIVNFRTGPLVLDCLASLEAEVAAVEDVQVVVTDNASGDDSPDLIEAAIAERGWSGWATLQRLPRNGGFAYGNNEAIRPALAASNPPAFVWMLNPDTRIRPNALRELLDFLQNHDAAGVAGSRLEDDDGTPQKSAFRFPSIRGELVHGTRLGPLSKLLHRHVTAPPVPNTDEPTAAEWMAGASLLVRREVFERVGLMDEKYFMYFEEVDFLKRVADAGFERWYVPRSRVVHLVGQASGVTSKGTTKRRPAYWFESRRRYMRTHLGGLRGSLADACWAGGFATYRLRQKLQRKPDDQPAHLLGDFVRHAFLPTKAAE
jgi:GT2 family glycosyltransferase